MRYEYRVSWEIDIEASTPREAAEKALGVQRDPGSVAVVFGVQAPDGSREVVDLLDDGLADDLRVIRKYNDDG